MEQNTRIITGALIAAGLLAIAACGLALPSTSDIQARLDAQSSASGSTGTTGGTTQPGGVTQPAGGGTDGAPGTATQSNNTPAPHVIMPKPATEAPLLSVSGTHIVTPDGKIWSGRGVTVHDTRNCEACTAQSPNVAEQMRRIDAAIDTWHADYVRLLLGSYPDNANGIRVQWQSLLDDPNYFIDVVNLVRHIGQRPNVYVLLSLWQDPSYDSHNVPGPQTAATWTKLIQTLGGDSHVIFAVANEPHDAPDDQVWQGMTTVVQAIRTAEDQAGVPHHVVSVQATQDWARYLDYYLSHPITVNNGANIVYETHVYDNKSEFGRMVKTPAQTLPLIIGEFGVVNDPSIGINMTADDVNTLMDLAENLQIPYTAWTMHQNCGKNSMFVNQNQGCGIGMTLTPSDWGTMMQQRLATPPLK